MGLRGQTDKAKQTPTPNHVDIVRFWPKGALTALKRVYLIKRNLYIYCAKNFLPYPMWDITDLKQISHQAS